MFVRPRTTTNGIAEVMALETDLISHKPPVAT